MSTAPCRRPRARALALSAACALLAAGCGTGAAEPIGAAAAAGTAAATGADHATVPTTRLPVYWVGDAEGEQVLFREFRDPAEATNSVDPIAAAAELMTAAVPEDPDYRTLWSPAGRVGSSTTPDGSITVDMPSRAFRAGLTEREARLALQQLAHTVSAAATTSGLLPRSSAPEVVLLVDGRPGEVVFGSVRLDEPLRADHRLESPVWLVDPRHGTRAEGPLTVTARVLEGVRGSRWTVTAKDGAPGATVSSGTLETVPREDGTAEVRADVLLAPGDYVLTVMGRDAGGRAVRDDKDVQVLPR